MKRQNRSLPGAEAQEVQGFGYQRQEQLEDLVEQAKQEEELEGLLEYLLGLLAP